MKIPHISHYIMTLKLALDLLHLAITSFKKVTVGVFLRDSKFCRVAAEPRRRWREAEFASGVTLARKQTPTKRLRFGERGSCCQRLRGLSQWKLQHRHEENTLWNYFKNERFPHMGEEGLLGFMHLSRLLEEDLETYLCVWHMMGRQTGERT